MPVLFKSRNLRFFLVENVLLIVEFLSSEVVFLIFYLICNRGLKLLVSVMYLNLEYFQIMFKCVHFNERKHSNCTCLMILTFPITLVYYVCPI